VPGVGIYKQAGVAWQALEVLQPPTCLGQRIPAMAPWLGGAGLLELQHGNGTLFISRVPKEWQLCTRH